MEAMDATEAGMNDLSLLSSPLQQNGGSGQEMRGRNKQGEWRSSQTPHQDSYSYSDFVGKLHTQYYETK